MSSFHENYMADCTIVKEYGNIASKVVNMNACMRAGIERKVSPKCSVNDSKLNDNLSRAKSHVKELALCNVWDFWCTFTIDPQKYDRYNLKDFQRDFSEFIHNYNRRTKEEQKVRYLLVPELHKDGAWHMHGFIRGIRPNDLYVNSYGYLTWRSYEERFGFISMDAIKNLTAAANYITKYITKGFYNSGIELNAHMYYCSKGLNKAKTLYKGYARVTCDWDYEDENGYVRVKWFDKTPDGIMELVNSVELVTPQSI